MWASLRLRRDSMALCVSIRSRGAPYGQGTPMTRFAYERCRLPSEGLRLVTLVVAMCAGSAAAAIGAGSSAKGHGDVLAGQSRTLTVSASSSGAQPLVIV